MIFPPPSWLQPPAFPNNILKFNVVVYFGRSIYVIIKKVFKCKRAPLRISTGSTSSTCRTLLFNCVIKHWLLWWVHSEIIVRAFDMCCAWERWKNRLKFFIFTHLHLPFFLSPLVQPYGLKEARLSIRYKVQGIRYKV